MRKPFWILTMFLAAAAILYTLYILTFRAMQTPIPSAMPPVVEDSVDELLQALKIEVEKYDPAIVQSLQPGITEEELSQAEAVLGQAIHPEMRALYRWHNGLVNDKELFPGYGFWSLQEAIRMNQESAKEYREKGVSLLMAHEKNWLVLFPDPAGDGYYFDPVRKYETGGIFFNFREAGFYRFFPSIRNLIQAIVECYQVGAYRPGGETDFNLEDQIMNRYGIAVEDQ